jgi:hypothetical protein
MADTTLDSADAPSVPDVLAVHHAALSAIHGSLADALGGGDGGGGDGESGDGADAAVDQLTGGEHSDSGGSRSAQSRAYSYPAGSGARHALRQATGGRRG